MSSDFQQVDIFNGFWERFSKQVASGKGVSDFPSDGNLTPEHVTTVVRLPLTISQNIESIGKTLLDKYPGHYLYPSIDLHFTFINLDAFFPTGLKKEHEVILQAIGQALNNLPPLEMEARGIGIFPTTVFVQLYDMTGQIEHYRTAINKAVRESLGFANIENRGRVEHVAFANLIRFKHLPERGLVDEIRALRDVNFGSFTAHEMQLVTTDRLLSEQNTSIHKIFPLSGQ